MTYRSFLGAFFGLLLASMLAASPASAGIFIGVSAPVYAFGMGEGVAVYWAPRYDSYVYVENGYYLRWTGAGWVYVTAYGDPWMPLPPGFVLPPLFAYGPPPPIVVYRPYFLWWRAHVAPWYAESHPRWWMRYHPYLHDYDDWRVHVIPYYAAHPEIWEHPRALGMRPRFVFHGRFDEDVRRYHALRARGVEHREWGRPEGRRPEEWRDREHGHGPWERGRERDGRGRFRGREEDRGRDR
ncbi:MAG: hypothetical protein ACYCQK_04795 [Acidiferrobacteraceae bacterium]